MAAIHAVEIVEVSRSSRGSRTGFKPVAAGLLTTEALPEALAGLGPPRGGRHGWFETSSGYSGEIEVRLQSSQRT